MMNDRRFRNIAIVASDADHAARGLEELQQHYEFVSPETADVIVALGGDGFMLETLHRYISRNVPIFGMHRGSVGFMMNSWSPEGLLERLEQGDLVQIHPLRMQAVSSTGIVCDALAINEVALLRETRQMSKIRVSIDGVCRLEELMCDGIMVATPAGSTAYNLSAHGPIIPMGSGTLALTPISAFRPRRWRGAVLPDAVTVTFDILEPDKRPVSAVADSTELRDVVRVEIRQTRDIVLNLLFDHGQNLQERVLAEQFAS